MQRDSERIFDEYLLAAARTGQRAAWRRLVERWQPRLSAHARRLLGDAERASDVVQDAWIEILRGLPRLDDLAAFPAWAYRITTRRCQRLLRRGQVATTQPLDDIEAPDEIAALVSTPCDSERLAEVAGMRAAIATLSPAQQAALALFYQEGLGIAEIAVALDVPPGTVKTRLMHARNRLRALMDQGEADGQVREDDR